LGVESGVFAEHDRGRAAQEEGDRPGHWLPEWTLPWSKPRLMQSSRNSHLTSA
jgi:hypothetical protein